METSSEVSCEVMDDDEDDDTDSPCHQQASCYDVQCQQTFYAQQISALEYARQANEYTKYAVESLVSSPEYQRIYTRCQLCWSIWSEGVFNESCNECGGFAMTRPCPICDGRCGAIWTRDVEMSHSNMESHWDGDCNLPPQEKQQFMAQMLLKYSDRTDEEVLDDFSDLSTK